MAGRGGCFNAFQRAVTDMIDVPKGAKRIGRVCKNSRDEVLKHKNKVSFLLHGCPVAKVDKSRRLVTLKTCGYQTNTTKDRLNGVLSTLRTDKHIAQKKGVWKINDSTFAEGMKVKW